jgi:CHAT domain-containing protein/tetratricopeptide (TPR) repeat protein
MNLRFLAGRKSGLAIALCVLALGCRSRESSPVRTAEPRFSRHDDWRPCARVLLPDHAVENAECGTPNLRQDLVSLSVNECDDAMNTAADAVDLVASVPQCTDAAVEKLEMLARPEADASLLSDLAGAYYVRAQRNDHPSDFVRSLDAAERACRKAPASTAARFNRALAQEELGFSADAIESWDALRKETSPQWSKEAAHHYEKLLGKRSREEAVRWTLNKERLPLAAGVGDRNAVRQLVAPYCTAARRYVEDEILPAWGVAFASKRTAESAALVRLAEMIAYAFAEITRDRYLIDVVDRIRLCNDPHKLGQLAAAHRAFSAGRTLELGMAAPAEAAFAQAESSLAGARSPLRLGAMLGRATALTKAGHYDGALALLRNVERDANEHHYRDLLPRVHAGRGYLLMTRGYDIDALAEYSLAQAAFADVNDMEYVGSVQNIIIGLLRRIGDENLTWRAALIAQRYLPNLVEAQFRHTYLGESALSAVELGYPSVALHYQNLAVRMLQDEFSRAPGTAVENLRHNLGIALRTRAGIYAILKDYAAAAADLAASTSLLGKIRDGDLYIPIGFRARLAETDAQKLASTDRPKAIEKLSEAIRLASATYYQTLTASLRLQRAELYRLDGNRQAATVDLQGAIAMLRKEEKTALEHKSGQPSRAERLWSAYFSRSQEAYRRLIRLRVEDGAAEEAFEYAEKARGYEPLHLVLQRNDLPAEFRDQIHDGEPLPLDAIREMMPAGAFLLEYSVLDDRTYVWIVGKGFSDHRILPVGESAIKQWTHDLQRFAGMRSDAKFDAALAAPYKELLSEPLKAVPRAAKLIIVPDRSMHGLPFAALRNGDRYLIQDHAVAVEASATLFMYSSARDRQLSRTDGQSVLLFADPAFNPHLDVALKLARLDAARAEARRIQTVYAGVATVTPPLMDGAATVPEFLRLAAGNTIIHLAAHGVANHEVPSRSFFLLAPAGDDTGVIDAEHLLKDMQLTKTRLAVLSACSSAGGTPVGPEGLAPLVRPFVAAGVPGVVGTLWNVNDNLATEDLLVSFHQHYRNGRDAAQALQLAQQEMIAHPSKAHHAAWAWSAFQMYGCASSPFRLRPITKEEIK